MIRRFLSGIHKAIYGDTRVHSTPGQSGVVWRGFVTLAMGLVGAVLVTMTIITPSKRNIEVLAGAVFMGFVLVAHPFRALLFTLCVIPFPARTTVGTTSTLLVFAMAGLTMMKSRFYALQTPFILKSADLAVMGWVLMLFLSFYRLPSGNYAEAQYYLIGFLSAVVLYYVTIQLVTSPESLRTAITVTQLVATALALLAILQFLFPEKKLLPAFFDFSKNIASREEIRKGTVRAYATFSGYELFGEYMAICSVYQYILARNARTMAERAFWIISSSMLVFALFGTGTRAAVLILVGGYVYLMIAGGKVIPRKQVLVLFFAAFAVFYLSMAFTTQFTEMIFSRMGELGVDDSSVGSRTIILRQAFAAIAEQPLLGHGIFIPPDTFRGPVGANIHNLYVHTAYTLGLPGLVAFVWFLVILLKESRRSMVEVVQPQYFRELCVAMHVCLVMFIIDQLKIEYVRDTLTMHLAWFQFGLIVATRRIIRESSSGWTNHGR